MEPKHHIAAWYGEKHGWLTLYLGDDGDEAEKLWADRHRCGALMACRDRSGHLVGRWAAEAGAKASLPRKRRSKKAEEPQDPKEPQGEELPEDSEGAEEASEDDGMEGGETGEE